MHSFINYFLPPIFVVVVVVVYYLFYDRRESVMRALTIMIHSLCNNIDTWL